MFRICQGKGFQLTFPNGCTISIQFGPGNYCEHYNSIVNYNIPRKSNTWESKDAEIAAWRTKDGKDEWFDFNNHVFFTDGNTDVGAYLNPTEVLAAINEIAAIK